ncbi:MAG: M15 family metallopeptidase [Verrucomicrobiota bacterium]
MNYDARYLLAQQELKDLGFHPGEIDGLWGEKSEQALNAWRTVRAPVPSDQFDPRTEANISRLTPKTREAARRFMAAAVPAMAAVGMEVKITSGLRTYAEQDALYAQGRTAPGPKVTNARAGESWHNFGCAWAITLFKDGAPVYESPYYRTCAEIGRDQGLDCGLFWKGLRDEPHYNLEIGLTMQQMREMVAAGTAIP